MEDKSQRGLRRNFHRAMEMLPSSLGVVVLVPDKDDSVVLHMLTTAPLFHTEQAFSLNHRSSSVGTIFLPQSASLHIGNVSQAGSYWAGTAGPRGDWTAGSYWAGTAVFGQD